MTLIKLDGSTEEGGGQILRTALSLSAITGTGFEITNIRKNRATPGLKAQHLYAVKAVAALCHANTEGAEIGSEHLTFLPRKLIGKSLEIDIQTAGSMTLVLQSVLLPALFCDKFLTIKMTGGSDVSWSPSFDYCKFVFLPSIAFLGDVHASLTRRGYYPKGAGTAEFKVLGRYSPEKISTLPELVLDDTYTWAKISGVSHASVDLAQTEVGERQAKAAQTFLGKLPFLIDIQTVYSKTESTGSGITLWAVGATEETKTEESRRIAIGSDVLGEKGKNAEQVGKEAAEELLKEMKAHVAVDCFLADQLIPILGLCGGRIRTSRITAHARANIYVTEQFLPVEFNVDEDNGIISCKKRTGEEQKGDPSAPEEFLS